MNAKQPEGAGADKQKALHEIYVYRDMVEGFMTGPQLSVENMNIAIAALQQARAMMLRNGITNIPRR